MLLTSIALAALTAPLPQEAFAADYAQVEIVARLRALRDPEHPPIDELAPAFAELAAARPAYLFRIMEEGEVPDLGEGTQVLSRVQRELILSSFELQGRSAVASSLSEQLRMAESPGARRASIRVWGAVGGSDDLAAVWDLSTSPEEPTPSRSTREAVRYAVGSIVQRDERGFSVLEDTWSELSDELVEPMLLALGDVRNPVALRVLSRVLVWRPALANMTLSQIRKVGAAHDMAVNDELGILMRTHLMGGDEQQIRSLSLALAAIRDLESIPQFIDMLDSDSEMVRTTAHWGLKDLTGLSYGADQRRWKYWLESEHTWLREEKLEHFRTLLSGEPGEARKALAEIQRHPLAGPELAGALGQLLGSDSPTIRVLACETAETLGDRRVVANLIPLLGDTSDEAVSSALRAAQALTGLDLPADQEAWETALSARGG